MKKMYLLLILVNASASSFAQWTAQVSGTTNSLRSVYFINENEGWVCGESVNNMAPILKTTDGGNTWALTNYSTANALRGIHFIDADTGIIVGFSGTILRSKDGGTTWTTIASGTTQPLRSVYFSSHDTGYICGGAGTMLKTVNSGITWTAQSTGITTDLINVRFATNDVGYSVASSGSFTTGAVIKTTNGGSTWTTVYSDALIGYLGVAVIDENTVYAGGGNQNIVKTTDGGTTWNPVYTGLAGYNLRGGKFLDANTGWMVGGTGGDILYTDDGGATWTNQDSLPGYEFLGINFPTANVGWTVGTGGNILKYAPPCPTLSQLGSISGPTVICSGDTVSYSVDSIEGATGYCWSVPAGTNIVSANGYSTIEVVGGGSSGQVSVTASNDCDSVSTSLFVIINAAPAPPVITFDGVQLSTGAATSYQWWFNGNAIPAATNQTYTPTQNGLYAVSITNANGCSAQSADFNLTAVGIKNIDEATALEIYPNPFSTTSTIFVYGNSSAQLLTITDVAGRMLKEILVQPNERIIVTKKDFSPGLYWVTLFSENNERIALSKLVVQ